MRRLRLVADDYGIAPGVSAAIRDLAAAGRLSATSAMIVTPDFPAEATRLRAVVRPRAFGSGLHVTLTGRFRPASKGFSPRTGAGTFPSLPTLMARAFFRQLDRDRLRAELSAQFAAFTAAFGRAPDHVDGHQHVQLLPIIRDVLLDLMVERCPTAWVRQCVRTGPRPSVLHDPKGALLDHLSRTFTVRAAARGIAVNPAFAGTYSYRPGADFGAAFPHFLEGLADQGVVMCHPGHVDDTLRARDPLTTHREVEFAFLAGDGLPAALAAAAVELA